MEDVGCTGPPPDGLKELYDYLEKFWAGHLASLKGAVEREFSGRQL